MDLEMDLTNPNRASSQMGDLRPSDQHRQEDPHFIAEYLAQNSSKAAAVFRRYDKLAMYRLIKLSQELRSLEREHDQIVESASYPGGSEYDDFFDVRISKHLKEYCTLA